MKEEQTGINEFTYEEFVEEYHQFLDEDNEKAAVLLAGLYPDQYRRYAKEYCDEDEDEVQ